MAGTVEGGLAAAATNKAKYGKDFYAKIGAKGGSAPVTKPRGFAYLKATGQLDKVRAAGKVGGAISKRPSKKGKPGDSVR